MPTDLDTQIRGLVVEVVESAPPPPELDLSAELTPTRTRRPIALVVIGIAVVIALVATAIAVVGRNDAPTPASANGEVTLSLDSVPKGVSARELHGHPVFLVRHGDRVTAFLSSSQHPPGEEELWWCPKEQIFGSPSYGEAFGDKGERLGGPSVRGLDRFRIDVRDGQVAVHLDDVIQGTRHNSGGQARVAIADETTWNTGPGSFCSHPVKSGTDHATLPLDAIAQGVTAWRLGRTPVFFVRDDDHVTVFISSAQHLPGETTLWWCPNEQVFYSPTHAERFAPNGTVLGGPAKRGLDRYETRMRGNTVTIDRRTIVRGEPSKGDSPLLSDPACEGRVVSGA
jgi:nitrite reductase/ring-hydroxylating ferredoxin subunit